MSDHKDRMVLTWSARDSAWLVEIPELPGAMADGATPEEAVANAQSSSRNGSKSHVGKAPDPGAAVACSQRIVYLCVD
jgi:hypothetical protein